MLFDSLTAKNREFSKGWFIFFKHLYPDFYSRLASLPSCLTREVTSGSCQSEQERKASEKQHLARSFLPHLSFLARESKKRVRKNPSFSTDRDKYTSNTFFGPQIRVSDRFKLASVDGLNQHAAAPLRFLPQDRGREEESFKTHWLDRRRFKFKIKQLEELARAWAVGCSFKMGKGKKNKEAAAAAAASKKKAETETR